MIDPTVDPELANSLGRAAMELSDTDTPPLIDDPPVGLVMLAGGVIERNGTVIRRATVREMTGADEEELARPKVVRNFALFADTLLNRCVETIGDTPADREVLDQLLIGDRDLLLQAIRVATYGDVMRLDPVQCPACRAEFAVDYSFTDDVVIRNIDGLQIKVGDASVELSADRRDYEIPLRRGRSATVSLVTGWVQRHVYTPENADRSIAELNTLLLQQSVRGIDGRPVLPADMRDMGSSDRRTILQFLVDAQCGPMWSDVKQTCPDCGKEFPLVIDAELMFRG